MILGTPKTLGNIGHLGWTLAVWHRELAAAIDHEACHNIGIPAAALMETAGRAVARAAVEWGASNHTVIVLCGRGNNGGDGLVAARALLGVAPRVVVYVTGQSSLGSPLFEAQLKIAHAIGLDIRTWHQGLLNAWAHETVMIIDALTGIGFKPPAAPWLRDMLIEANTLNHASVLALDVPSGLDCDQGSVSECLLPANVTVTFGAPKPMHVLMPAAQYCGHVIIEDIGFTNAAMEQVQLHPVWLEVSAERVMEQNPWSKLLRDSHKFDRGHVLVIGGSDGKTGAPILAGMAALRTGAGWVSVALPDAIIPPERTVPDELTMEKFFCKSQIDSSALDLFLRNRKVRTVIIGPGWTSQHLDAQTVAVLAAFVAQDGTVILDAGATADVWSLLQKHKWGHRLILTPHPGEWTRLNGSNELPTPLTIEGVQELVKLCKEIEITLIYKGASPIIIGGSNNPNALVCTAGSPRLARAGSGDVLTGIIGAHSAIGCESTFAVARGYTLMARAAVHISHDIGDQGILASDLIQAIGRSS